MAIKEIQRFDPQAFLATVGAGRSITKFKRGQAIFRRGDAADAVFFIQKGKVKLTVRSEQGKEAVIAMLGDDDFFREGCLAGQPRHMASAVAMSETMIIRIEMDTMIRVLHEEPRVKSRHFLEISVAAHQSTRNPGYFGNTRDRPDRGQDKSGSQPRC